MLAKVGARSYSRTHAFRRIGRSAVPARVAMTAPRPAEPDGEHLRTDALQADLKRRAVRSGVVTIAAQAAAGLIALASTVVLARLLRPEDFGLMAMALPIAVVGTVVRNFGLDVAIIQRAELTQEQVSALFWLSCKLNLVLGVVLAAAAPLLGWFFAEDQVTGVALAFAAGTVVVGVGGLQEALLKRQMRFGVLAAITAGAALVAAGIAILLAAHGAGPWALVAQILLANVLQAAGAWVCCGWRPLAPARSDAAVAAAARPMLAYGRNLSLSRILTLAANFADRICVGWLAGPTALGFYENGRRLPFFLLDRLYDACFGVAVAGFSRAGDDPKRYRAFATRALQLVLGLLLPAQAFVLVEAEPITLLLLGPAWEPAIPYVRLLAAAAFAHGFLRTLQWFQLSQDRTSHLLRWNAIQTAVIVAAVGVGAKLGGPLGVAVGFAAAAILLIAPAAGYGLSGSLFSPGDFTRACARPTLIALLAGAALWGIDFGFLRQAGPGLRCLGGAIVFGVLCIAGWTITPNGRAQARQLFELVTSAGRGAAITPPPPPPDPQGR